MGHQPDWPDLWRTEKFVGAPFGAYMLAVREVREGK